MKMTEQPTLRDKNRPLARLIVYSMWGLFLLSLGFLVAHYPHGFTWSAGNYLHVDNLSLIMISAVALFSSIVLSYSSRYLSGSRLLPRFMLNCVLFTAAVITMVIADNIILFIAAWTAMGLLMAWLIGGYTHLLEGQASRRNARKYFLMSSTALAAGLVALALQTGHWSITGMQPQLESMDGTIYRFAALALIAAAFIQAALYPFQHWLMSSMTAPTPASALMHAGFVNAGAILLTRFAPMFHVTDTLWILVLAGGVGALIGKFSKFVQANIKQKLACSTTAQMGFMLLECGLGYFSAAVAHLILHGLYKAYLFLSSGDSVSHEDPHAYEPNRRRFWHLPVTLASGIAGGVLFAWLTGKGMHLDSGLFLNLVVVLTIIHGTQDVLSKASLPASFRLVTIPLLVIPALLLYGIFFEWIAVLLGQLPLTEAATPISAAQIGIGLLYLVTFLAIELDWYRKSRRLYVTLLNMSQPHSETIKQ